MSLKMFDAATDGNEIYSEDNPSFNLKVPQNFYEVQITWSISGPPINSGTTAMSGFSLLGPF